MENNRRKSKIISTKYTNVTEYNDNIQDYNDFEAPDPREIDDESMNNKSYALHTFPDPDW